MTIIQITSVAPDTCEGYPGEAEAPGPLVHESVVTVLSLSLDPVWAIHQQEGHTRDSCPDDQVQSRMDLDSLVLGDVEEVASHQTDDVTLIPPAPG